MKGPIDRLFWILFNKINRFLYVVKFFLLLELLSFPFLTMWSDFLRFRLEIRSLFKIVGLSLVRFWLLVSFISHLLTHLPQMLRISTYPQI